MAWTQHARDAAAMARKMHGGAKAEVSKMGKFNLSASTLKSDRKAMAKKIKQIRNGLGNHSAMQIHDAVSGAATSTRLRNLKKK